MGEAGPPTGRDVEAELRRRLVELAAANSELEAFFYTVSHDLRAPVQSIQTLTRSLLTRSASFDDRSRAELERLGVAARRLNVLFDDILRLSRTSVDAMRVEQVDLSSLATEIVAELREASPERVVDVSIEGGLTVTGDARLLRLLLANLMANAWKFTAPSAAARIDFTTEVVGGQRVFALRDNGVGFDMAYADRLFGPFQRLHGPEFEGTGIGLAIARRIVDRHGGRIWAEATPGRGASFFFTLQPDRDLSAT